MFSHPQHQRVGVASGIVWHRDTDILEFDGGATSDYGMQVFAKKISTEPRNDTSRWTQGIVGGNCAFRRQALEEVGGFDPYYTYYLDETDTCFRIARAGWKVSYLPNNGIRHYAARPTTSAQVYRRAWDVITRSDTYFALRNAEDPVIPRIIKTFALAPRKHYVIDLANAARNGLVMPLDSLRYAGLWISGIAQGAYAALTQPRALAQIGVPPPFLLHEPIYAERPLRIGLLTQTIPGQVGGYGGIGRYTFDLARGLHERGHEVHVICKDATPIQRISLGMTVHGIASDNAVPQGLVENSPTLDKNVSYSLAVADKLAQLHAQGIVLDVVHATNWDAEAVATIRAGLYPTVLMLVSPLAQVIQTERWPVSRDLIRSVELDRWQMTHAAAVCTPSVGVLRSYEMLMGVKQAELPHLATVGLGIVPEGMPTPTSQTGPFRLLFVGRCERRKGIHTLLAVLPNLLTQYPEWECHLVGNDLIPLEHGLTARQEFYCTHKGQAWLARVHFHGSVDEEHLQRHYAHCDIFVAPSLFESFGLIYHEAMQYGKPVVGCQIGGVPEAVEDGLEGLLVTPDSPAELYMALQRLISDPARCQEMGKHGATRVHQRQNYRTMAEHMEQIYRDTIEHYHAH